LHMSVFLYMLLRSGVVDLTIKTATAAAAQLQAPAAAAAGAGDANIGPQIGTLLSSIALHSARASCMALQQLLLLLGCISQLGRVGSTQLTASDQAAISQDEIPRLVTALRSAAVALWLCKTPANAAVAGASGGFDSAGGSGAGGLGPLLGLRLPTPSGTPAGTPRDGGDNAAAAAVASPKGGFGGAGVQAAAPAWQQPLAAHLLPLFWKQQGQQQQQQAGAQLGAWGNQLAVWLMLGAGAAAAAAAAGADDAASSGSSAAAAVAAVTSPQGLAGRAVLLGYQLFVCREYDAMQRLVQLIGGSEPSEAGLQFILGLSIACGLKKQTTSSSSSVQLDSAVGHLFRAAAGMTGEEAAPLRLVLQLLRQRQGGSSSTAATAGASAGAAAAVADMEMDGDHAAAADGGDAQRLQNEAQLKLQFCQAVVLLFEREGVTQGALAFARAALGAVDAAYGPEQQQEKVQQQGEVRRLHQGFACSPLDLAGFCWGKVLMASCSQHVAAHSFVHSFGVRHYVQSSTKVGTVCVLLYLMRCFTIQSEEQCFCARMYIMCLTHHLSLCSHNI
jgi:hypothetical protein